MATLYVDFENGNDNYGGTSFALLAQGTNGRITSTTFSSVGATFPNDGSLIGQYLSIFNGTIYAVYQITAWLSSTSLTIAVISGGTALSNQSVDRQYYIGGRWKTITSGATAVRIQPGDTVRVMESPDPVNLGINGTWTSSIRESAIFNNSFSTTNTSPITVSTGLSSHNLSTGDTIVINGVTGNTNANGVWEITVTSPTSLTLNNSTGNGTSSNVGNLRRINNSRVVLSSAVTANIASTGPRTTAWIASANVTTSLLNISKEHYYSDSINISAAFTTGKAAYYTVGALDLSGYQQVSFWMQISGSIGTTGSLDLRLCSDTIGDVPVNTITIPLQSFITNRWTVVTVDAGAPLGSSINSIALYVNTDVGAQSIYLSNIIACKSSSDPNCLTLSSLIGKNTTEEPMYWGIQSINGTRVVLDGGTAATPSSGVSWRGYYGTTETVTLWKREPIKNISHTNGIICGINESGTTLARISYSGGWDRLSMSTQSGQTLIDGQNGSSVAFTNSSAFYYYIDISKFSVTRAGRVHPNNNSTDHCTYDLVGISNMTNEIGTTSSVYKLKFDYIIACDAGGIGNSNTQAEMEAITGIISVGGIPYNETSDSGPSKLFCRQSTHAKLANNSQGPLLSGNTSISYFRNFDSSSFTISRNTTIFNKFILGPGSFSFVTGQTGRIISHAQDSSANNHKIITDCGMITTAIDQRKTSTGISWKFQPTKIENCYELNPLKVSLAKIACGANTLVTVRAWMRRDNTGLAMRLVCKGGQISGVVNDLTSSVVAVNAWEQQTITFTPTEIGVVEITAEAWGGTTYSGWVDDLTISQA